LEAGGIAIAVTLAAINHYTQEYLITETGGELGEYTFVVSDFRPCIYSIDVTAVLHAVKCDKDGSIIPGSSLDKEEVTLNAFDCIDNLGPKQVFDYVEEKFYEAHDRLSRRMGKKKAQAPPAPVMEIVNPGRRKITLEGTV